MKDCIFCKIVAGQIPSSKVYENDRVFAFEDINPVSEGHTLIIPKRHAQDLWQMPPEDLAAVHLASKKIGDALKQVLNPSGIALLQLNGRGVNQVVMHYHLHLIPRRTDAPELPMTHWEMRPGDMDAIGRLAKEIAAAITA